MRRLLTPSAIIVMCTAAWNAGCARIPQVDPIDARTYLESASPRPADRRDAVSIQPIGLRKGSGQTLLLDLALEGPAAPAEKAALFVRSGIFFEPGSWLDIINPDGRRVTLAPAPGAISRAGNGLSLEPEYRLRRDAGTVRLLIACRFATRTPLRGGRYRVRLDEKKVATELKPMIDAPLLIADGWHGLRLVRGRFRSRGVREGS